MARFKDIVVDAAHPASLARFWAAALEGYAIAPYGEAEIARLAAMGRTPETDYSVIVEGPGPRFCFHEINPARYGNNRVHIDVVASDVQTELVRLTGLGATVQREGEDYTVLADPEGNQFCLMAT